MILVLLGTQNNSFIRLLDEIENLIEKNIVTGEVIVQSGYTKKETSRLKMIDFMPNTELEKLIVEAEYIITHGGVGSIIGSITKGKKVIAVPRKHKYKEHVNDHQLEIVEVFNNKEYIIGINEIEELENAIKRIETFKPKTYEQNNKKMLKTIEEFIG